MELVINEWFLEYMKLDPAVTKESKEYLSQFIQFWVSGNNKIVIRRPSPFLEKYYKYMKQCESDLDCKRIFSSVKYLFYNSDKTIFIDDENVVTIPSEVAKITPTDDLYLIQSAYSSNDKIIVTTDEVLKQKLQDIKDLKIYLTKEYSPWSKR